MAPQGTELLIVLIVLAALLLTPLVSRMIGKVGEEISRDLDGGRTGSDLTRYLTQRHASLATPGERTVRDAVRRPLI